jgi:hypothetical protein
VPPPLAGNAPGTAPDFAAPATGASLTIFDAASAPGYTGCGDIGVDCQLYKFDVPAGGGTYDFSMTRSHTATSNADLGLFPRLGPDDRPG